MAGKAANTNPPRTANALRHVLLMLYLQRTHVPLATTGMPLTDLAEDLGFTALHRTAAGVR